jgi:HPt (histidine-containing phosphotransfer) domain-containing protein
MAEQEAEERIQEAIARVLEETRPMILERAALIERAAVALSTGAIDPQLLDDARRAAHMLAGTLGTFGLERGTALARDLELRLTASSQAQAEDLVRVAAELRASVRGA